nr:MAG TPA: hypothetical protein [Caudoviricetes sp.]
MSRELESILIWLRVRRIIQTTKEHGLVLFLSTKTRFFLLVGI